MSIVQTHKDIGARTDLVQAIYQVAVDPSAYDQLIEHWGQFLLSTLGDQEFDAVGPAPVPEDVSSHLLRAFEILDRLGRAETKPNEHSTPRAELVLGRGGLVSRSNGIASKTLGALKGHSVFELSLSPESRARLRDTLLGNRSGAQEDVFVFFDHTSGLPVPMVHQQSGESEQTMILTGLNQHWTEDHDHILQRLFGLTQAETTLARRLLNGASLKEVADASGRSIDTVRTQLKSIRRKTYTSSQQQLVRIMTGLENLTQSNTPNTEAKEETDHCLTLQDGRTLSYREFGPKDGLPCLFIHNMLSDPRFSQNTINALFLHRLRLICPIRSGFGASDKDPASMRDPDLAPDRFVSEMKELLSHMTLQRITVVGYMSGAIYGFRLAQKCPALVTGILNISGAVPLRDISQIHAMNARQKIIALTARLTPGLLPSLLRAGIAQLDAGGVAHFLHALYKKSPTDMRIAQRPEIQALLYEGFHQIVKQGHMGFAIDSHHVVRNWGRYCKGMEVPVQLLHGELDQVVTAKSVRSFAKRMGYEAHIFEGSGQLILHQHASVVISHLAKLAHKQLTST